MTESDVIRGRLLELVDTIREAREQGIDSPESHSAFEQLLPDTDVDNLCNSDYDDETIVDICLGEQDARRACTRDELVELVKRFSIVEGYATEAESILAVLTFEYNCRHPAGCDLIFYYDPYFDGRDPTPEENVDLALRGE
ncbi:MAG: bacteriocin immunity protein [Planctomycetales bacterium]|nr:bacteriocin immunity protein [Planctomycetales bacterium]